MKIAFILNDKRININIVKYIFKNFIYISNYDYDLIGIYKFNEIKKAKADLYIIYGNIKKINIDGQFITIPYVHYQGQREEYKWVSSEINYIGKDISNKLPILNYTIYEDSITINRRNEIIELNFDLFWNVFFHMSLYREYIYEQEKGKLGSYFYRLGIPSKIVKIPVVNCLYSLLGNLINKFVNVDKKTEKRDFSILMTHDVDAINKTVLIKAKQSAFLGYNALQYLVKKEWKESYKNISKAFKNFFSNSEYFLLDKIIEEDSKYNLESVFFIYARRNVFIDKVKYGIFNPQYDINNLKVKSKLKALSDKRIIIGLHGGFEVYNNLSKFKAEKDKLENIVGKVEWNRNHWLRFSINESFGVMENNGIKYDSTLGFNDQIGFRSGLCTPYFPYDFEEERAYDVIEYPLSIMDSTLFNYLRLDNSQSLQECESIKRWIKKYDGTLVLNWHNRVYSRDFNWHIILEDILSEVKK